MRVVTRGPMHRAGPAVKYVIPRAYMHPVASSKADFGTSVEFIYEKCINPRSDPLPMQ